MVSKLGELVSSSAKGKKAEHISSKRTWKSKLKEWKFDKYFTDKEKNVLAAKVSKRKREGKETQILNLDRPLSPRQLDNFGKRKAHDRVSPEMVSSIEGKFRQATNLYIF